MTSTALDPTYTDISPRVQSPRLQFPGTTDPTWLSQKTILITGGASGFGALAVSRWASSGATVIFGDINISAGTSLASSVRKSTGNENVHFVACDVSDWSAQVALFKTAVEKSLHGGIDCVVANAGITDPTVNFENPVGLDGPDPPPLDLKVLQVNLVGVAYTAHLALFWLQRNPGSVSAAVAGPGAEKVRASGRDRHLLLVGSIASLGQIPLQAFYGASKHAVLGLYRCLRSTSMTHGVRVSFVAPYFIETPILPVAARVLLAGAPVGDKEDVVEAMTRFVADPRIVGRAVCVGPKLTTRTLDDGTECLLRKGDQGGEDVAIWEFNASDFETVEAWNRRLIGLLVAAEKVKGWTGFFGDILKAFKYGLLKSLFKLRLWR